MALGAAPAGIFKLVVGHGLRLTAAGLAMGVLAALGLTRMIDRHVGPASSRLTLHFRRHGLLSS